MPYKILHIPTATYLQTRCYLINNNNAKYSCANFDSPNTAKRIIKQFVAGKTGSNYTTQEIIDFCDNSMLLLCHLLLSNATKYEESEFEVVRYYNV